MSFQLSSAFGTEETAIFLTNFSETTGKRFDAHYYQPKFEFLEAKLDELGAQPLYKLTQKIFSGVTPLSGGDAYTEDEGVAFIRSGDFNEDGTINEEDLIYLKQEVHSGLMKGSQLKKDDVLFAIVGATIGKVGLFNAEYEANINQAVCAVRTQPQLRPQFLHAFFLSGVGQQQIERVKRPVARANINLEEIGSLRVPPLPEPKQKQVEQILQLGFQRKRATEAQAKAQLAQIDTLLLHELGITPSSPTPNDVQHRCFTRNFSEVTGARIDPLYLHGDLFACVRDANCDLVKLGSYVQKLVTGFAAGRSDQGEAEKGIIQIRPTNMSEERELVFKRNVYIHEDEISERPADLLTSGEVLFNNTNSQEQVGKTVFFDIEGNYFCSNHITRIVTTDELDSQYLATILNLYQRQKVFFRVCTNWNNQSGVGREVLENLLIPLPNITQQKTIVTLLEEKRLTANSLFAQAQEELATAKHTIEAMILGEE